MVDFDSPHRHLPIGGRYAHELAYSTVSHRFLRPILGLRSRFRRAIRIYSQLYRWSIPEAYSELVRAILLLVGVSSRLLEISSRLLAEEGGSRPGWKFRSFFRPNHSLSHLFCFRLRRRVGILPSVFSPRPNSSHNCLLFVHPAQLGSQTSPPSRIWLDAHSRLLHRLEVYSSSSIMSTQAASSRWNTRSIGSSGFSVACAPK